MHVRTTLAVTAALLIAGVAALAPTGAHTAPSDHLIDVSRVIEGADTYMFSIRTTRSFNVLPGSFFEVTGIYDPNVTAQDAGAMVGVVRSAGQGCPNAAGKDPCFVAMSAFSIKDDVDAEVVVREPTTFAFSSDPDAAQWGGGTVRVDWAEITGFQKAAPSDPFVHFRFFATVPEAVKLVVRVHVHANGDDVVEIRDEVWHDGGFLFVGDDYAPAVRADTLPASAMVAGEAVQTQVAASPPNYLYAMEAPSWVGVSVLQLDNTFALTHNTAAVSDFGIEMPSGGRFGGLGVQVGGIDPGVAVVGAQQTGDYKFWVREHAGVGPQDLYTVGFTGPLSS